MKSFVLHDESINTRRFKMRTAGANLDEFRKNPVMLSMHNDFSMPIGRWENIRVEGTKILADPVFDDGDPLGKELARKVADGFIKAASIGAWPPEEVIEETDPITGKSIPVVTKWTVREASIVPIGANHNALVFYDRQTGEKMDSESTVRLFDLAATHNKNSQQKLIMNEIAGLLKLSDTASPEEIQAAVKRLLDGNESIKAEVVKLTDQLNALQEAEKAQKKAQASALVDAAIKTGRIDAKAKDSFIKLFDTDFDAAKQIVDAIPLRRSVTREIDESKGQSAVELADLSAKSWDELDKAGKLVVLKDRYPDLYAEKFEAKYGKKPNGESEK